jgi:hypothetical protein
VDRAGGLITVVKPEKSGPEQNPPDAVGFVFRDRGRLTRVIAGCYTAITALVSGLMEPRS